jgi:hypothetical protein
MQDKKVPIRLGLSLLSAAILIPLVSSVNHFARISEEQIKSHGLQADSTPIPPIPPPKKTLVADLTPIHPLPLSKATGTLVADGTPVPPIPPPKKGPSFSSLIADGAPILPLPPPKGGKGRSLQLSA